MQERVSRVSLLCFLPALCWLLLGLFLGPEDADDMFLRIIGCVPTNCKALYPGRYKSSMEPLAVNLGSVMSSRSGMKQNLKVTQWWEHREVSTYRNRQIKYSARHSVLARVQTVRGHLSERSYIAVVHRHVRGDAAHSIYKLELKTKGNNSEAMLRQLSYV
jgi:hypothetical protein